LRLSQRFLIRGEDLQPCHVDDIAIRNPGPSICGTNPNHLSHVYSANLSEKGAFVNIGYTYDAIEGYIYPISQVKPFGTTELKRAYNLVRDDYRLYATEEAWSASSDGYTESVTILGYVYLNNGSRPTY
jgi:hypothetical protein